MILDASADHLGQSPLSLVVDTQVSLFSFLLDIDEQLRFPIWLPWDATVQRDGAFIVFYQLLEILVQIRERDLGFLLSKLKDFVYGVRVEQFLIKLQNDIWYKTY